jgi:choline dehydrogenase-like flavoprotein
MGYFALAESELRRARLPNTGTLLFPRHERYQSTSVESLKALLRMRERTAVPLRHTLKHVGNVLAGMDDILVGMLRIAFNRRILFCYFDQGGWSYLENPDQLYASFEGFHITEQFPSPENRVALGTERDSLGLRRAKVYWRWGDEEIRGIRRIQEILRDAFRRSGLGHFQVDTGGPLPERYTLSASHHMGTTRMHLDPKQGVVDENCKVHGVSNLFIASSSVFPTGGAATPTLTIIALSIRLADHLKRLLNAEPITVKR